MANNEERYCQHCKRNTLFFWDSDLIWYCDECGNPFDSKPVMDMGSFEFQEELEAFEEENGEAIYCKNCGNFIAISDVMKDRICPICSSGIDDEQLEEKGYVYDEETDSYIYLEEE